MEITPLIKADFVVLDEDETISEMIGKLKQEEKRSGLVFRNKKYIGLVEKKRLLRLRMDSSVTKIKGYVQKTPILSEHADVIETAYLMFQSDLDFLPVERNKVIVGVLQGLDVVGLGVNLPEAQNWKVSDAKLIKPKKLFKDDPIGEAINIMHNERIDQIPVFDGDTLYGVLTYRDLLRKYLNWSPRRDNSAKFNVMASSRSAESDMPHLSSLPVRNFSSTEVVTTKLGLSLKEAVNLMQKYNFSCLPVVEGGEVKGLLTVKNVLSLVGSLKIPKNFNIQFVGLKELKLEPYQKYNVQKISSNEAFKLQRNINNDFKLVMHIKEYNKEGTRCKYAVNLRIEFPGKIITSSQNDWDIETAVRKAFNNAKLETASKFTERERKKLKIEE